VLGRINERNIKSEEKMRDCNFIIIELHTSKKVNKYKKTTTTIIDGYI